MNVHLPLARAYESAARCLKRRNHKLLGVAMSITHVPLPTRRRVDPAAHQPLRAPDWLGCASDRPRVVRMPADWWDAPSVISCPLTTSPQAARTARRLTRSTLRD